MERLNDWLNAADIHLLPQKAVAADLVLPSKRLGLCVPPEDVEAFTAAASRLVDDPGLRAGVGAAETGARVAARG